MWKSMRLGACAGLVVVASAVAACTIPEVVTGGGGSSGGGDAGGEGGTGSGTSGTVTGKGCTIQTTGGAFLCTGISTCPPITVDQATFSQCGFLTNTGTLDVECECGGYLCPLGTASTCAQVSSRLATGSATSVCDQLTTGGCRFEGIATGSGSGGGCDTGCASQCLGDSSCLAACGC
jgi:hypothetical protein